MENFGSSNPNETTKLLNSDSRVSEQRCVASLKHTCHACLYHSVVCNKYNSSKVQQPSVIFFVFSSQLHIDTSYIYTLVFLSLIFHCLSCMFAL